MPVETYTNIASITGSINITTNNINKDLQISSSPASLFKANKSFSYDKSHMNRFLNNSDNQVIGANKTNFDYLANNDILNTNGHENEGFFIPEDDEEV